MFFSVSSRALRPHVSHAASFPWKFRSVRLLSPSAKCPEGSGKLCPNCAQLVHWGLTGNLLENVAELCAGNFLIKSVHNLRKSFKNLVFFDIQILPAAISKLVSCFFLHFVAEGHTFFLIKGFLWRPSCDAYDPWSASGWQRQGMIQPPRAKNVWPQVFAQWYFSMQNIDVFEKMGKFSL